MDKKGTIVSVVIVTLIQALVTIALLGFSFLMRDKAPSLADTVVGFACGHWLNQSSITGRQMMEMRQQNNSP